MRRSPLPLFAVLALLLAAVARPALAAGTLVVNVPAGSFTLWLEYQDEKGAARSTTPVTASGGKAALDLAPLGAKFSQVVLVALGGASGNLGTTPVTVKAGATPKLPWRPRLNAVSVLQVRAIGADGQPSAGGTVTLTDSKESTRTQPVLPGRDGIVEFQRAVWARR